jgi:hypothetical protein
MMKNTKTKLLSKEILSGDAVPVMIIRRLKVTVVNQDMVTLIKRLLACCDSVFDRERTLLVLRKLLLQNPRTPDPDEYNSKREYFDSLTKEQRLYDPIKWIDAELQYLSSSQLSIENKEIFNEHDLLQIFGSRSTLQRRIDEKMPCAKFGNIKLVTKKLFMEWIESNSKLNYI